MPNHDEPVNHARSIMVSLTLDHSVETVWEALADLASHPTWMKDAIAVNFHSAQTRGSGTSMDVVTRIGPFRTTDVIEVVGWIEGKQIEVVHRGLITGRGILEVEPEGSGSTVTWIEDLEFPWWLGGPLTAWIARPFLRSIWRANLQRLDQTLSAR